MGERKTALYKMISEPNGNRYRFYCDASGALACTTKEAYKADTPEQELQIAWEKEGREVFNQCHKCGKYVIDAMYNAEVLECVQCAPYEMVPNYCKTCGAKIENPSRKCPACGNLLVYEGGTA